MSLHPQQQLSEAVQEAEIIARGLGLMVVGGDGATGTLPEDPALKEMLEIAAEYLDTPLGLNNFDPNMHDFKR